MPTMPTTVKLGPIVYTIQHSHEAADRYSKEDGTDVYACCQNRLCNIIVDEGYPISRERRTLLHEVLHALWCIYHLTDMKLDDEHTIQVASTALLSLLRDNPELVAYLVAE